MGFKRENGAKAGEWFLSAYYYGFDATERDEIDNLLSSVAVAGKRFHNTSEWSTPLDDPDDPDAPSCADEIQVAANQAAAALTERDARIARLEKALVWVAQEVTGYSQDGKRFVMHPGGSIFNKTEYDGTDASLIETLCRLAEI